MARSASTTSTTSSTTKPPSDEQLPDELGDDRWAREPCDEHVNSAFRRPRKPAQSTCQTCAIRPNTSRDRRDPPKNRVAQRKCPVCGHRGGAAAAELRLRSAARLIASAATAAPRARDMAPAPRRLVKTPALLPAPPRRRLRRVRPGRGRRCPCTSRRGPWRWQGSPP